MNTATRRLLKNMKITFNNVLAGHIKIAELSDRDLMALVAHCDKSIPMYDYLTVNRIKRIRFKTIDEINKRKIR